MVCASCTRGVQENGVISLVVLQSAEVLEYVSQYISYACILNNTPKPRRPGVMCTTSSLVFTSCTRGVQENSAIGLIVVQSAENKGLIVCFTIHFLCVIIE